MWQDHQEAEGVIEYRKHRFVIFREKIVFYFCYFRCSTYWRGISRRFLVNLYGYKSVKGRFARGNTTELREYQNIIMNLSSRCGKMFD